LGSHRAQFWVRYFFLIFINDLSLHLEEFTRLFADDTTVNPSGESYEKAYSALNKVCEKLIEWCKSNALEINWNKTFCMIISNKSFERPLFLNICDRAIKVVKEFKLLGVILDDNLNFQSHACNVSKMINKKLYSIRRIFGLSFLVKVQFFKTFILPYFDFCSGLIIYWSKTARNKLIRTYSKCLKRLLKIDLNEMGTINEIDLELNKIGLRSLQSRLFYKLLLVAHNNKFNEAAPKELKEMLVIQMRNNNYELRASTRNPYKAEKVSICSGEKTFGYFFTKFLNKLKLNLELFNSKECIVLYL